MTAASRASTTSRAWHAGSWAPRSLVRRAAPTSASGTAAKVPRNSAGSAETERHRPRAGSGAACCVAGGRRARYASVPQARRRSPASLEAQATQMPERQEVAWRPTRQPNDERTQVACPPPCRMRRLVPSLLRAASVQAARAYAPPASLHNLVAASARFLATVPPAARPPQPPPPSAPPPPRPLPAIVDVVDRAQLPALVASSHEKPLLLVLHVSGDAACAAALQVLGDALTASPDGFRLALVEVNELPDVAERLRCAWRGSTVRSS